MKIEIPEEDRKELDARMDKEWKQKHGKGSYYKTFGDTTPGMVHGPVEGSKEQAPPRPFVVEVYGLARNAITKVIPIEMLDARSFAWVVEMANNRKQ